MKPTLYVCRVCPNSFFVPIPFCDDEQFWCVIGEKVGINETNMGRISSELADVPEKCPYILEHTVSYEQR